MLLVETAPGIPCALAACKLPPHAGCQKFNM